MSNFSIKDATVIVLSILLVLSVFGCAYLPRFPRPATTEDIREAEGRLKEEVTNWNGRVGKQWEVIQENRKDLDAAVNRIVSLERDSEHVSKLNGYVAGIAVLLVGNMLWMLLSRQISSSKRGEKK